MCEKYRDQVRSVFEKYCAFGEPLNTTRLKSAKFLKMLRDCRLVAPTAVLSPSTGATVQLKAVDADLIYAKVTGIKLPTDPSQSVSGLGQSVMISTYSLAPSGPSVSGPSLDFGKKRPTTSANAVGKMMDFEQFLAALVLVAQKLMPDLESDQSVAKVIEECLLPLDSTLATERTVSNDTLVTLMNLLKEKEMTRYLSVVHRSLEPYYKAYANTRGLMLLDGFLRFCSDFGIFPDIVAKPRLSRIFYTIANIYMTGALPSRSRVDQHELPGKSPAVIDDHLFVEAIALCAFEVPYKEPQPSDYEKVRGDLSRRSCFLWNA